MSDPLPRTIGNIIFEEFGFDGRRHSDRESVQHVVNRIMKEVEAAHGDMANAGVHGCLDELVERKVLDRWTSATGTFYRGHFPGPDIEHKDLMQEAMYRARH